MPATMTTVNSITKEIYQGQLQDQLQNEIVGIKRLEKTSRGVTNEVGGKYVTFPIRVRRNHSIGYRNENETLQAASQQGYASVRVPLKYGYGRVEVTGQTMELAKTNYQAFANAMNLEMTGLKNDIAKDVNRIFYGDGSGFVATVTAATGPGNNLTVGSVQYAEVGMIVDVVNAAGTVQGGAGRLITAINTATKVITVDGGTFTTVIGWGIVRTGNTYLGGSGTPPQREPTGLGKIITNTGALFNVDPATEPVWAATVDANGGTPRALSEGLMIKQTDLVRKAGGNTSLILAGLGVRRAYFNLLTTQRRYTSTKEFDGGIQGLAFHNGRDIPVVDDVDAPDGQMKFLDESALTIYRNADWSWVDTDGNIWKWVTGKDSFEALLACYWELGTNRRNAHATLNDLIEG
jgi:hypothetical protein